MQFGSVDFYVLSHPVSACLSCSSLLLLFTVPIFEKDEFDIVAARPALRLAVSLSVFPTFYDINFQPVSFSFTHSLSPSPSRAFCVSSLFLSFFSAEQSLLFVTGISTMDSILVSPL